MYDVIIIGSGVAGSTAAYFLAEAGVKVLVLEKAKLPRYKTCGGGVVQRAVNLLPFSIDEKVERKLMSVDIFDQKNTLHFYVTRDLPMINMLMRKDFDYFILKKAVEKGAAIRDNFPVEDIQINSDNVYVKSSKEHFRSKFLFGADGATGITAKKIGMQFKCKNIPALESEIEIGEKEMSIFINSARIDFGFIPYGYAWVFPKKRHLSIGVLTMKTKSINLHKYLEEYILLLKISNVVKAEKHGFVVPLNPKDKKFVSGRIMLIGDAAGLVDPITAEGISNAIDSGRAAAGAIIAGAFSQEKTVKIFIREMNKILSELKYAKILSLFVYTSPVIRSLVFKKYGKKISEVLADVYMGERSYSGILKDPLTYFKLLKTTISIEKSGTKIIPKSEK